MKIFILQIQEIIQGHGNGNTTIQLAQIRNLQFDSQIILYVSDTANHRIINLIHFKRFLLTLFKIFSYFLYKNSLLLSFPMRVSLLKDKLE